MPLLIMCGFPCSGKSTLVTMLTNEVQKRLPDLKVVVVAETASIGDSDNELDQRNEAFADSRKEREMRSHHKSEIERALTQGPTVLVISDGNNYIKGYRYELYCLAKSLRHQHVILHCNVSVEKVIEWNSQINRYSEELINDLVSRFEPPNPSNRWDQPILIASSQLWDSESENLVTSLIEILTDQQQKCVQPNRATQMSVSLPSDFLQVLDRVIQRVIEHIGHSISIGRLFIELPNEFVSKDYEKIRIQVAGQERRFSPANLARIKRCYMNMQRTHLPESSHFSQSSVAQGFFQYLSTQILPE